MSVALKEMGFISCLPLSELDESNSCYHFLPFFRH